METIFALSSGALPAGIAVVRVSGPRAAVALKALSGGLPAPRRSKFADLRDNTGQLLDQGLVLWFPGPNTATGEDLAEFHLHGGRAVVAAVEATLGRIEGLRKAEPGEFTRRAFANGRIDLAEAEGLASLLEAETELQRQIAIGLAGGLLSREVETWREELLLLSASLEAVLDFEDEGDVSALPDDFADCVAVLGQALDAALAAPSAETLREGFRVALAGPPNAGKSTLFNVLVENEAAITTPIAGTTRDVLTRPVGIGGVPFTFVDMAGLHERASDAVEVIGIERARLEIGKADLVLWLGPEGEGPAGCWEIEPQVDVCGHPVKRSPRHRVSSVSGEGVDALRDDLVAHARIHLPKPGEAALSRRQRDLLLRARDALAGCVCGTGDPLIMAEHLRIARLAFDQLIGRSATEDVLDTLFGRFCIGK